MQAKKAALRREVLARRSVLPEPDKIEAALKLRDLAGGIAVSPGQVVSGFWPIRGEIDLRPLMARLRKMGATIVLPTMVGDDLVFRVLDPSGELVDRGFGTMGPPDTAEARDPDILLVPLAAFDTRGHRIGYGRGFYDRALARLRLLKPIRAIGIAFSVQEVAHVPNEAHDAPLDAMLTETGYRRFPMEPGA
ncbi:MAG: 5-formyltetrahydrofolate cyclo-ligase [Pseudomonadota bacterium]